MGDLVLATGLLEDLHRAFPGARIILFAGARVLPLAKLLASPDEVVVLPHNNLSKAASVLKQHPVDVLIDLGQWTRYEAILTALAPTRFTVGFSTAGQHRHYLYDATAPLSRDCHELENFRSLLRLIGVNPTTSPTIRLKEEFQTSRSSKSKPALYIVFHMWPLQSGDNLQREWPAKRWLELARYYNQKGISVALTGSKADQPKTEAFLQQCTWPGASVIDACEEQLSESIHWLAKAQAVIAVNTGIMHVGAALGVPLVGLHGPTSAKRWGPVGARSIAVRSSCPGAEFLHLGIEYSKETSKLATMDYITVEEVIAAAEKAMDQNLHQ